MQSIILLQHHTWDPCELIPETQKSYCVKEGGNSEVALEDLELQDVGYPIRIEDQDDERCRLDQRVKVTKVLVDAQIVHEDLPAAEDISYESKVESNSAEDNKDGKKDMKEDTTFAAKDQITIIENQDETLIKSILIEEITEWLRQWGGIVAVAVLRVDKLKKTRTQEDCTLGLGLNACIGVQVELCATGTLEVDYFASNSPAVPVLDGWWDEWWSSGYGMVQYDKVPGCSELLLEPAYSDSQGINFHHMPLDDFI
ncbi:hypothetical protein Tco_0016103 [Tanacetum coccineum]